MVTIRGSPYSGGWSGWEFLAAGVPLTHAHQMLVYLTGVVRMALPLRAPSARLHLACASPRYPPRVGVWSRSSCCVRYMGR
jgi:hypothetical protein